MSKRQLAFLSIFSSVLLSLAWFDNFTGIFLFIALFPVLYVEDYFFRNRAVNKASDFYKWAFLTIFVWNVLDTWWIKNASFTGMIVAFLVNTFQFSFILWLFHYTRRKIGSSFGYFALIVFWITYEHFYLHAEISWPWLTLGYGFANDIKFIQWYEYTGALGGSLWILVCNVLVFNAFLSFRNHKSIRPISIHIVTLILLIGVPIGWSLNRYNNYQETGEKIDVVIIQPNIDPYEKFVAIESIEQTQILIDLAEDKADKNVDYFIAPETAINNNIWIDRMNSVSDIRLVRQFVNRYPDSKFVVGITCYQRYDSAETPTARQMGSSGYYYDSFNSAIQIDTTDSIQIYHKSQLVVGVEKMPYPQYLGFLKKLTLQLGGTFRSHGTQVERGNLVSADSMVIAAPVICYESVFGEYVTGYINKGANIIFIITNDGWWGDTPGHRQHKSFASIRAIETRRSIARSANTGISCTVNQRGEILQELGWWERGSIRQTLYLNDETTFYTKSGDYIAKVTRFFSLIVVLYLIVTAIIRRSKTKTYVIKGS